MKRLNQRALFHQGAVSQKGEEKTVVLWRAACPVLSPHSLWLSSLQSHRSTHEPSPVKYNPEGLLFRLFDMIGYMPGEHTIMVNPNVPSYTIPTPMHHHATKWNELLDKLPKLPLEEKQLSVDLPRYERLKLSYSTWTCEDPNPWNDHLPSQCFLHIFQSWQQAHLLGINLCPYEHPSYNIQHPT